MLKKALQTLPPSYFALVMATGIVATASQLHHYDVFGNLLFWINNIAFVILLVLFVFRAIFFFPLLIGDLSSHAKGVGFLTIVAGSCILGTYYAQINKAFEPALVLWCFGLMAWVVIIFSFLSSVILKTEKPSPEKGLDGSWFLLVVSTQSISILAATLAPQFAQKETTIFISLFAFFLGVMLYLMLAPIVLYRLLFYPVTPGEVLPTYWVNAGAAAITTFAALVLSDAIKGDILFSGFYPVVYGIAFLFWATASFWIPIVFMMEVWRYVIKRSPLKYTAAFWSMVFPLGMYCVCTHKLAETISLPGLQNISKIFLYLSWLAWLGTLIGLFIYLVRIIIKSSAEKDLEPKYSS